MANEQHLPWMKLWVYDFIGKTVMWPGAAAGLYAQCLILEWASGPLPDDAAALAAILKYSPATFATVWPTVRTAFEVTAGGRLVNPALEAERAEAHALCTKLSDAGKKGAKKSWSNRRLNSGANGQANGSPNGQANALQHHGQSDILDSHIHTHARIGNARTRNPPVCILTFTRQKTAIRYGLDPKVALTEFNQKVAVGEIHSQQFRLFCQTKAKARDMDKHAHLDHGRVNGSYKKGAC